MYFFKYNNVILFFTLFGQLWKSRFILLTKGSYLRSLTRWTEKALGHPIIFKKFKYNNTAATVNYKKYNQFKFLFGLHYSNYVSNHLNSDMNILKHYKPTPSLLDAKVTKRIAIGNDQIIPLKPFLDKKKQLYIKTRYWGIRRLKRFRYNIWPTRKFKKSKKSLITTLKKVCWWIGRKYPSNSKSVSKQITKLKVNKKLTTKLLLAYKKVIYKKKFRKKKRGRMFRFRMCLTKILFRKKKWFLKFRLRRKLRKKQRSTRFKKKLVMNYFVPKWARRKIKTSFGLKDFVFRYTRYFLAKKSFANYLSRKEANNKIFANYRKALPTITLAKSLKKFKIKKQSNLDLNGVSLEVGAANSIQYKASNVVNNEFLVAYKQLSNIKKKVKPFNQRVTARLLIKHTKKPKHRQFYKLTLCKNYIKIANNLDKIEPTKSLLLKIIRPSRYLRVVKFSGFTITEVDKNIKTKFFVKKRRRKRKSKKVEDGIKLYNYSKFRSYTKNKYKADNKAQKKINRNFAFNWFESKFIKLNSSKDLIVKISGSDIESDFKTYKFFSSFFRPKIWSFIFLTSFYSLIGKSDLWKIRREMNDYLTHARDQSIHIKPAFTSKYNQWFENTIKDNTVYKFRERIYKNYTRNIKIPNKNKRATTLQYLVDVNSRVKPGKVRWKRKTVRKCIFAHNYWKILVRERRKINHYFELGFTYQHRMTRYLWRFKNVAGINISRHFFGLFMHILYKSNLLFSLRDTNFIISKGFVYLNGLCIKNKELPLFKGDVVSMVVNWHVFKYLKLTKAKLKTKNYHLNKLTHDIVMNTHWHYKKLIYYRKYLKYVKHDTPYFIELDYTTLSFIMILEPSTDYIHKHNLVDNRDIHWNSIFQLNWKYIV